ncbi:hypothetical protein CANCADRAFT_32842 [Tortispora caseinolytica NRRL Y-17796]|uniref:Amino acid permease/ SLC12A domain-containing protein n=1 Tax=Tortispora caseinolytica NRRL Y-17796 TaxID=767744 RepID=A0A1E4TD58_9ASCO|nr:hypothetical protein CANCADRAFT_32842 [Tortispora caseinolytica NRRL Y-17796]
MDLENKADADGFLPILSHSDESKAEKLPYDNEEQIRIVTGEEIVTSEGVRRGLKVRHISMIALGGTIGTGLFIGTGEALANAGPAGIFISYIFMATIVFSIAHSLGEMAAFIPVSGSFAQFTSRFLHPSFGFAMGWLYWFSWAMTFAIEVNVAGLVIQYWTDAVPMAAWITIFLVCLSAINYFPVKFYGEIEFWVASIKVIAIVGWLIYALCMACGAGDDGAVGFRYWRNPGAFGPGYYASNPDLAKFLGWVTSLINAAFTYQGTELVGVTAGESANPRKAVPRAINKVFYRIAIFYILSILFMGMLVPYNSPYLLGNDDESDAYVSTSPFIIAMQYAGTPVLPDIFNAVILTTIISAGNSNVYIGARILMALTMSGNAPKFFGYTNRFGVPYVGVTFTAIFGALSYMNLSAGATSVFNWFVNITTVAGLITWALISFSHIRFMQALDAQGFKRDDLPFKALFMPWYAWYAGICITIIIFVQGFTAFLPWKPVDFVINYLSLFIFIALVAGHLLIFRKPFQHPVEMDLDTGRREVDALIWDDTPPKNIWEKFWYYAA